MAKNLDRMLTEDQLRCARTRKGVMEGRVIVGSERDWEPMPVGSRVELS